MLFVTMGVAVGMPITMRVVVVVTVTVLMVVVMLVLWLWTAPWTDIRRDEVARQVAAGILLGHKFDTDPPDAADLRTGSCADGILNSVQLLQGECMRRD